MMRMYILAMSEYAKDIRRELVRKSDKVIEHLVKIILYPTSEYVNGWKQEIYAFIHKIDKMKHTKRYPSYNFVMDALSTHLDVLDNYIKLVKSEMYDYSDHIVEESEQVHEIVTMYMQWLASKLSSDGIATRQEVYFWIDKNILTK